uniref:MIF4G domain-containing protein n=1 Tax=Alexandrium monilatum TaxID=311494 RepID=A0A7S4RVD5_9DINO
MAPAAAEYTSDATANENCSVPEWRRPARAANGALRSGSGASKAIAIRNPKTGEVIAGRAPPGKADASPARTAGPQNPKWLAAARAVAKELRARRWFADHSTFSALNVDGPGRHARCSAGMAAPPVLRDSRWPGAARPSAPLAGGGGSVPAPAVPRAPCARAPPAQQDTARAARAEALLGRAISRSNRLPAAAAATLAALSLEPGLGKPSERCEQPPAAQPSADAAATEAEGAEGAEAEGPHADGGSGDPAGVEPPSAAPASPSPPPCPPADDTAHLAGCVAAATAAEEPPQEAPGRPGHGPQGDPQGQRAAQPAAKQPWKPRRAREGDGDAAVQEEPPTSAGESLPPSLPESCAEETGLSSEEPFERAKTDPQGVDAGDEQDGSHSSPSSPSGHGSRAGGSAATDAQPAEAAPAAEAEDARSRLLAFRVSMLGAPPPEELRSFAAAAVGLPPQARHGQVTHNKSLPGPSPKAYRLNSGGLVPRMEELRRTLQSLLNKVCPESVATIAEKIGEVKVESAEELQHVIALIFKKAISEPHYCETYADLVFALRTAFPEFPCPDGGKPLTLKAVLLNICQDEFEALPTSLAPVDEDLERYDAEELELRRKRRKDRVLANMKLIGHLFLRQLLSARVISSVIQELTLCDDAARVPEEHVIECAVELLMSIGHTLESMPAGKQALIQVSGRLLDLKQRKGPDGRGVYCKRIQFAIQDLLDARAAGWVRKVFSGVAKTKEEIRLEQERELVALARGQEVGSGQVVVSGQRPRYISAKKE